MRIPAAKMRSPGKHLNVEEKRSRNGRPWRSFSAVIRNPQLENPRSRDRVTMTDIEIENWDRIPDRNADCGWKTTAEIELAKPDRRDNRHWDLVSRLQS